MENKSVVIIDREESREAIEKATMRLQARLLRLDDVAAYCGCGRTYARRLAEHAGAVRKLGSSWLCDRLALDAYLDEHPGDLVDSATVARWREGRP